MSLYLKRMGKEQTFHLHPDKKQIVIGRSPVCDINFPSVHISRQHCQILRIPPNGTLILKNIKNTNCTYIDAVKLQNSDAFAELHVGCCIGLGVPLEFATVEGVQNQDFVFLKLESSQLADETRNNARTEHPRSTPIAHASDPTHPRHLQETATRVQGGGGAAHSRHPQETATRVKGGGVSLRPQYLQENVTRVQGAGIGTHQSHLQETVTRVQGAGVAAHSRQPQETTTHVQGGDVALRPQHLQETVTRVQGASVAAHSRHSQETATRVKGAGVSLCRHNFQDTVTHVQDAGVAAHSCQPQETTTHVQGGDVSSHPSPPPQETTTHVQDGVGSCLVSRQNHESFVNEDELSSRSLPNQGASTSPVEQHLSKQAETSQASITASNTTHMKDTISHSGKSGGENEGKVKHTRPLENSTESSKPYEVHSRKVEGPVAPVQILDSNPALRQSLTEKDTSCIREADDGRISLSSVSKNEEAHSPISIDLTQADPDSPMSVDVPVRTRKESFICLLSSDEDFEDSSPREGKLSGKRKRLTPEPSSGVSVAEEGEGSSCKKKVKSSLLDIDIDSDSKDELLTWKDSNVELLTSNTKTDVGLATKDSGGDSELLGHETKSNKNLNEILDLSDSDNELFIRNIKMREDAKRSHSSQSKQDSESEHERMNPNLKKGVSDQSLNNSTDEEPLVKRKLNRNSRIILSSDSDSDFEDVDRERSYRSPTLDLKKCSVPLTRVSPDVHSSLVGSRGHSSLTDTPASTSNNKDTKNHSSETRTNDLDGNKPKKRRKNSVKDKEMTRKNSKEQKESVSISSESHTSAGTSTSFTSADLKGRNELKEKGKLSSKCNSEESKNISKEPVEIKVEAPTEIKIKTEPSTSWAQMDDSGKDKPKKDDNFMYSQVGVEIWLSSDEEESPVGNSISDPARASPDLPDLIFLGEDEQQSSHMEVNNFPVKEESVEDDNDVEDQWFPVLSQSFLVSSDEEVDEEEKDDVSKVSDPSAVKVEGSEPQPGPSGICKPLPDPGDDDDDDDDDMWWPCLSQGFFDEVEDEEDTEKEKVDSSENSENRDELTKSGSTNDLQSVIEKLRKSPPRTSQLTEAKIPMHHLGRRGRRGRSTSSDGDFYSKAQEPPTVAKKLPVDPNEANQKQSKASKKPSDDSKKTHKKQGNSNLRKNLTSKFNLEGYKTTLQCRTKEKHHLVEKRQEKAKKPPPDPVVNKTTVDPKSNQNISIQKKTKSAEPATQDKVRPKVAAKVTKKTRFEKLIDVDLFSLPSKKTTTSKKATTSKKTTTSKKKNFTIPKACNVGASCSSKNTEAAGSGLVLDRKKNAETGGTSGRSESPSNNAQSEIQNLLASAAPTCSDSADKVAKIKSAIKKVKSKPKKVHFPEKEDELVKKLLISPRRKVERTGLPSVRASEMLPEELKLQRQNIPPYYMELFVHHVCHWNYDWLESYHRAHEKYRAGVLKGIPELPPIVASTNYPILILYSSYNDYRETHSNLFYLELWERIFSDWVKRRSNSTPFQSLIEYVQPAFIKTDKGVLKFLTLKLMVAISPKQGINNHHFRPGTLISLKIRKDTKRNVIFGYVDYIMVNRSNGQNPALAQMGPNLTLGVKVVHATIQTVKPGTVISISDISYLRPSSRVWESLHKLPLSPLCRDILSPTPSAFLCERKSEYLVKSLPLNEAQTRAVTEVSSKCMFDSHVPKLSLIHGPPGTGKTSTIVALIAQMAMIGSKHVPVNMPRCKVLICAPSNAAVDELTLRIIGLRRIGLSLRLVRVGFKASDHPVVKNYTLDQFVNKKVQMELSTPRCESARQELQRRKILVQLAAEDLEKARKDGRTNEIRPLEIRLNEMARAKAELERSFVNEPSVHEKHQLHQKWQQEFLLNAEVVTTTLNSCVSGPIVEVLANYPYHFTCCIVDEAGQCQETETLLPLLLGIRKLVLVGDHKQLPATVLSQMALSKNLKQSMFERLHHRLVLEMDQKDVVHTLNVQYRMHPQIVEWPAYHFYQNKLVSQVSTQPNTPLNPYVIFDLKTSQEQRHQSMELYNPAEASLVCALLEVMQPHLTGKTVGIITPYQRQRFYLEEKLFRLKEKMNLSINTIDGFQGQERDVIVLSFVRANNSSSIGFLSHRQRLNVALTRAKEVCYIVASLSSLDGNREWHSLIRNGRQRRIICTVTKKEENDKSFLKSVIENKATRK